MAKTLRIGFSVIATGLLLSLVLGNVGASGASQQSAPVMVTNTTANPVPVTGNVGITGTPNVNVSNSSLTVAPQAPVTDGGGMEVVRGGSVHDLSAPAIASALSITISDSVTGLDLRYHGSPVGQFIGPGSAGAAAAKNIALALTRPIKFDEIWCYGSLADSICWVGWIGTQS